MIEDHRNSHVKLSNRSGFTLVELMLTMAISGIIMAAIYSAYIAQQRTYLAQEQVAQMQQNIRAAMDIMTREIRMAGYNPNSSAGAGITTALPGELSFTQDLNSDGDFTDSQEDLTYSLYVATDGVRKLGRRDNTGAAPAFQAVAEGFDALEFRYLDAANAVTAIPADIRSIQISILARANRPDTSFTNTMIYTPASGNAAWDINGTVAGTGNPPNDNFRRRLLITSIQCRNLGLE